RRGSRAARRRRPHERFAARPRPVGPHAGGMTKTILVGLDGSPRQPKVLEEALALAEAFDGRLHLARAMAIPLSIPAAAWTLQGNDFSRFLVQHGQKELEEAAASVGSPRIA